jgi:hypothetical protein
MNSSLTLLTCGRNATGLSAMFSVERDLHASKESTILSRCLVNVGDTTQRFCSENRIKLSRVCCVIITSLSPHNVSGLPGMLLGLSSLVSRWSIAPQIRQVSSPKTHFMILRELGLSLSLDLLD